MLNYIIRRLLLVPLQLLGVTALIFAVIQVLSPEERAALYIRDVPKTEKQVEGIIRKYGLDRPIYEQYWTWLVGREEPDQVRAFHILIRDDQTLAQQVRENIVRGDPKEILNRFMEQARRFSAEESSRDKGGDLGSFERGRYPEIEAVAFSTPPGQVSQVFEGPSGYHIIYVQDFREGRLVGGVLRGNLGYSHSNSQPVADLIAGKFPATLELALWAALPVVGGGIVLGVIAAVNHNRLADHLARVFSIVGWSFPTFVFGLLALLVFYVILGWFGPGRVSQEASNVIYSPNFTSYTQILTIDSVLNGRFDILVDALRHLAMPVITLSYLHWALMLRVTRSSMLEVLRQDYIVTARAKGLAERTVIRKHALPNALMPVVTLGGMTVAGLLGGVVITETVFNYPGIGRAAAEAATQVDVVAVLGFTLFIGLILILSNLVVDILYAVIDPRVRLD